MMLVVTCSACTCICLIFVSCAVSGFLWYGLVVSIFINTIYIIENLAFYERICFLEAERQLKDSTIEKIRHCCRDLFIRNAEVEKMLRGSLLQSHSAHSFKDFIPTASNFSTSARSFKEFINQNAKLERSKLFTSRPVDAVLMRREQHSSCLWHHQIYKC